MGSVTELIQILREQGDHETYEVAAEADVEATESALGCSLHASFREFVMTFSNGAYLFGVQEVSAVGRGNAQIVAIQDIDRMDGKLADFTEWLTILAREQDEVIRTLYGDDVIYDELMLG